MKRSSSCMTFSEAIVVICIVGIIAILFLISPMFQRAVTPGRRITCASNLEQIGRAIGAYYGHYNDYYPFFESRRPSPYDHLRGIDDYPTDTENENSPHYVPFSEQRPMADGEWTPGVRAWWATDSLTLLYPEFLTNANIFHCPSTDDKPEIFVKFHAVPKEAGSSEMVSLKRILSHFGTERERAMSGPRWSSYGYNNRIHPTRTGATHVVAGDMDHTAAIDPDLETANHPDGGNYLYFDGAVRFQRSNYASNNPADHIFMRQNALKDWDDADWGADTDVWLRRP